MEQCLFCNSRDIQTHRNPSNDTIVVECPKCIRYEVSEEAVEDNIIKDVVADDRILFSGYLRNNALAKNYLKLLSADLWKISEIVNPFKKLTAIDKVTSVIKFLAENSNIGTEAPLDSEHGFTQFYCKSQSELREIKEYLRENNLIRITTHRGPILTIDGWEKYEKLKQININSKIAFVAMSFNPKLKCIFDAIDFASDKCSFKAERVDSEEHNEKICDRIIAKINESRFIVADFTENKHGVYFEAGYALGLNIPVIWTCSKDFLEKEQLHFDTRQYNHIVWKDGKDLANQLINRIKATIR